MKYLFSIILFFGIFSLSFGQIGMTETEEAIKKKKMRYSLKGEAQWYPAGWIQTAKVDLKLGNRYELSYRLGLNRTRRNDWSGLNDDERGEGIGTGLGFRAYWKEKQEGLFAGARTDFWWLQIDWTDYDEVPLSGFTNIIVFQPTVEVGYLYMFTKRLSLEAHLALGREINIRTVGEEVGQGGITLIGVALGYHIN